MSLKNNKLIDFISCQGYTENFRVVASSESYEIREISQMKYSNERFHTGGFIMGDVYERNIDDESKKLI